MMDRELLSVLFLAFLPGIVLVISGAISAVRTYGLTFLWCLRFQPVREKLRSMLYEMHPATTANAHPGHDGQDLPGTNVAARVRSDSALPVRRRSG